MPGWEGQMRRVKTFFKDFRRRFYEGPDWIELPAYVRNSTYRSPTLLIIAWGYAYYTSFFTVAGRIIIAISFLIVSYSLTLMQNPIRILAFSLIAIFAGDFIIGFLLRPRLKIIRDIPVRARARNPVRIDYHIVNLRPIPVWNVSLDSYLPGTSLKHYNGQTAAEYIPAKTEVELSSFLISEKRGVYSLPIPLADSIFPFGIFRWISRGSEKQRLLIYPDYSTLDSISLPVGRRYQRNALPKISKVGDSMEFMGCREFRTGDNPRHIHWPSTARTGEIIVREFQDEYISRTALIVDTSTKKQGSLRKMFSIKEHVYNELEAALALSAAIAENLLKGDFVVEIFAAGPEIFHLKSGRSLAQFENILDILACIEPCHGECFIELKQEILNEISDIGSAIVILLKWDKTRAELIRQLAETGTAVKIVFIYGNVIPQGPPDAIYLNSGSVLSGGVKDI
jgi:uncharacterized protein (DUF58 family)